MDDEQIIEAEVYSYGGCMSCGGGLYNYLRLNKIKFKHHNVQITSERQTALERAAELGVTGKASVYFPMIFIGGKVVTGFKPDELNAIIKELREES